MERRGTERRRKSRRRRRWKAVLIGCLLLCASALIPWGMTKLPRRLPVKVRDLYVSGMAELGQLDVKSMLAVRKGDPLYGGGWVSNSLGRLAAHPRVRNTTVARSLTGDVMVRVAERKTEAIVNFERLYFVDETGAALGSADPSAPGKFDLVILTGPWSGKKPSSVWKGRIAEGVALKRALAQSGFEEKRISEVHWNAERGWEVVRVGLAARIVMGKVDFAVRAARLARVLGDFQGKESGLSEIDLDFEDRVVVKLVDRS